MNDITPEKVAAAVSESVGGWRHRLQAALSLTAKGNVLDVAVTRWDGPDDAETVRHFRAVIVEGGGPVVVASPEFLRAARALYRWHVAASSLSADQFATLVYDVDDALAALTPEQVSVLAGDDEQDAQAEQGGAA